METRQTKAFADWLTDLSDRRAQAKIAARIVRIEAGNLGDVRSVGDGVSEVRINYGPGYRLYFTVRKQQLIILLIGGDKGSQMRDIRRAKALAAETDREGADEEDERNGWN